MKGANIILDKSAEFAIAIVKCTSQVAKEKQEYVITKQLLKSGTSIGANVSESEYAQSKLDFIHKLSISLKEANESRYWINILKQTNYISLAEFDYLMSLINGIIYLLSKSIKTAKENLRKENEAKKNTFEALSGTTISFFIFHFSSFIFYLSFQNSPPACGM